MGTYPGWSGPMASGLPQWDPNTGPPAAHLLGALHRASAFPLLDGCRHLPFPAYLTQSPKFLSGSQSSTPAKAFPASRVSRVHSSGGPTGSSENPSSTVGTPHSYRLSRSPRWAPGPFGPSPRLLVDTKFRSQLSFLTQALTHNLGPQIAAYCPIFSYLS